MTADRARVAYDPMRQYRAVVAQQGCVTLEADTNEAAAIASEALRLETIDIIGPTAALGGAYLPGSGNGPGGVSIAPGVFYLGGWRLELDAAIDLSQQPDWLDQPPVEIVSGTFLVALLLNEQTVCAVEDQALREVALGGPDTAARVRLMQHFLRLPLRGRTCAAGAALVEQMLAADGVTLDPATLQIMSQARLQVGFVPGPGSTDPCTPAAAGGYLGADNQLVRVTVIAYDANAKTGTLLWGWNNASILYRASMADPLTLTLTGTPVDSEHAPQLGQAVEILRSEADLGDGNFIAAPQGFVTTVAQAYNFDTGEVRLADPLPNDYGTDKNPLFIRLWQAHVPFVAGQATALDNVSGITVTITLPALPTQIALRPFWRFAARPSTPVMVYPQRYLEAPQPPDGPRQWIADLAVMAARRAGSTLVEDCRVIFVPPRQPGGQCCALTLGPDDVAKRGGLQAVLDGLGVNNSGVSLLAGNYPLDAPLKLAASHAGLTLEACGGSVILQAQAQDLSPFAIGLIQLNGAAGITLRGLTIAMPVVPIGAQPGNTQLSVGVFTNSSPDLTIEDCIFQATVPTTPVTGMGLAIGGFTIGLAVRGNRFLGGGFQPGSAVFGIVASATANAVAIALDRAEISHNLFQELDAGVFTFAHLGFLRCTNNRVAACRTGLFFADSNLAAASQVARAGLAASTQSPQRAALSTALNTGMQVPTLATVAANMAQVIVRMPEPPPAPVISEAAHRVLLQDTTTRGTQAWNALAATAADGAEPPSPGAPPANSTAAGAPISSELSTTIANSLDTVLQISLAAELAAVVMTPVLHISGNDVSLVAVDPKLVAGAGIAVVVSPRDESATVLMTANRVITADSRTIAAGVLFPAAEAVTGNIFVQTSAVGAAPAPAFASLAEASARVEVMANVIVTTSLILPARASPWPMPTWNFLNTVG